MTRALVLGGGGITGVAWEIGLLVGLREAGVDLAEPDVVIGTSAGSVVGAQLRSDLSPEEMYGHQVADLDGEVATVFGRCTLLAYAGLLLVPSGEVRRRSRLGRASVRAAGRPGAVTVAERVEVISAALPSHQWPEPDLRLTAVDAHTGDLVVLDRHGEVGLVDAVASSCAVPLVWPPVPAGGRHLVDGGVRSATNADLATGAERVVVLAPLTRSMTRRHSIPRQLGRTGAVASAVVSPDAAALAAIGRNPLDPAQRAAAARAGRRQAASVAGRVREAWGA